MKIVVRPGYVHPEIQVAEIVNDDLSELRDGRAIVKKIDLHEDWTVENFLAKVRELVAKDPKGIMSDELLEADFLFLIEEAKARGEIVEVVNCL